MQRGVIWTMGALMGVVIILALSGCGGPNTEGQSLEGARQTLADAGVQEEDISLTGPEAGEDPATLVVCNQSPSGAEEGDEVTLEVATTCPEAVQEDDDDDDDRRRRSGGRRR